MPSPRALSAIGERHRIIEKGGWRLYTPRHAPEATLENHLIFALKNEGLDLAVLNRLFLETGGGRLKISSTARQQAAMSGASGFCMNG